MQPRTMENTENEDTDTELRSFYSFINITIPQCIKLSNDVLVSSVASRLALIIFLLLYSSCFISTLWTLPKHSWESA